MKRPYPFGIWPRTCGRNGRPARPQGFSKTPGVLLPLPGAPAEAGIGSQAGQAAAHEEKRAGFGDYSWTCWLLRGNVDGDCSRRTFH
jgi:hypothetical protein